MAGTTNLGFAYLPAGAGYEVYSLAPLGLPNAGQLLDTGNKTAIMGPLAVLDKRAGEGGGSLTGQHFAYILTGGTASGPIVEYSIDKNTLGFLPRLARYRFKPTVTKGKATRP